MKKFYSLLWLVLLGGLFSIPGLTQAQAPVNDDVCNALPITQFDTLLVFDNIDATSQSGEAVIAPSTNGPSGRTWNESGIRNSVWFTFEAPASGAVRIDLCNDSTNFDTQIAVFDVTDCNDFNTFTLRGANDDIDGRCPFGDIWASTLEVNCLVPNQTYYLIVDGWVGGTTFDSVGTFGMQFEEIPADPFDIQPITIDPTCDNTQNGVAAVIATGGDQNYTYQWSAGPGFTQEFVPNLGPGSYTVTVRDGCDSIRTATIVLKDPVAGAPLSVSSPDTVLMCQGGNVDLGADLGVNGGVPQLAENVYALTASNAVWTGFVSKLRDPQVFTSPTTFNSLSFVFSGDFAFGAFFCLKDSATTKELWAINVSNGSASRIGSTGQIGGRIWAGMAFDPTTSTLYGMAVPPIGVEPAPALYTLDINSGAATLVDTFNGVDVFPLWLAIDNQGQMYVGEGFNSNLASIDKATATATNIGYLGYDLAFDVIQDADFDPVTNQLYMSVASDNDIASQLRLVDVNTGRSIPAGGYSGGTFTTAFAIRENPGQPYDYTWSPNNFLDDFKSSNPVADPPPGWPPYFVEITDECGNTVRDTVTVFIPPALTVSQSSSADTGSATGSATVIFEDGVPPYSIVWENGDSTQTIDQLEGDQFYGFVATDGCGTTITDSIFVLGITSVEDLSIRAGLRDLVAYPNPTQDVLNIDIFSLKKDELHLEILDSRGALLRTSRSSIQDRARVQVSLEDLPAGIYLLKASTSEGVVFRKILKK